MAAQIKHNDGLLQNPTIDPKTYRPDIDGLRAFAVLLVVIYHAFPEVSGSGFMGVDVFFVISGFLIGGIVLRDLAEGKFSFFRFYSRRILRIFPALGLVLCAVLTAGYFFLFNDELEMLGKHVFGGAAFISNLVYYYEAGYWDINSNLKPLLHLWSLGLEEQFYIIIPIILAVAWKRKYRLLTVIAILFFASFACNIYYYKRDQDFDFYMPFTRFWEIFAGVVLAALNRGGTPTSHKIKIIYNKHARHILSILGLAFLIIGLLARRNTPFPGHRALWPAIGTAFIIAAGPQTWLNRKIFSNKLAVGIGVISYPLYLWHWPILSFASILNGDLAGEQQWWHIRLFCVLIAVILAALTYIFVERPVRFGKGGKKNIICALLVFMICTGSLGLYFSLAGAPERSFMAPFQSKMDQTSIPPSYTALGQTLKDNGRQYAPELRGLGNPRYWDAGGGANRGCHRRQSRRKGIFGNSELQSKARHQYFCAALL